MRNIAYADIRKFILTYMLIIELENMVILENEKEFQICFEDSLYKEKEKFINSFYHEMKEKYKNTWLKPIVILNHIPDDINRNEIIDFDNI